MATTELTVQSIVRTGLNPTYSSAASGDGNVFDNDGRNVFVHIKNGGSSITATFETPGTVDGMAIPDLAVTIPGAEERMVGPFPQLYEQYDADNAIDKAVTITFSGVTSVTIAAVKLPKAAY